ncbi:uncharacterized protein LOC107227884 [Neodiprion lecontei]|uniref:Uncharacterized protein LOC107227884 n=1 Tax=Neodiprion lecontei TaxID=441921 RepID=A0A6J0CF28_NEOLC|nr:uncharacterized protein LOC107227884 [Neodiprion lecontei]
MTPEEASTLLADQATLYKTIGASHTIIKDTTASALFNEHQWEVRLDLLEKNWKMFSDNDLILQRAATSNKELDYFAKGVSDEALSWYIDTKAFMLGKIKEFTKPPASTVTQPTVTAPQATLQQSVVQTSYEAIKLPTFNGVQKEWQTYKEQFTALVINEASMAPVIKLQRLMYSLGDEARRTIQTISVIGDNFTTAWETLCQKFDNPPLQFRLQMETLVNMPSSSKESAAHLSGLLSTVSESISSFTALGRLVKQWDDVIIFFITTKISERTRLDWFKYISTERLGNFPTFKQLETFLKERIRSLELAHSSLEKAPAKPPNTNNIDTSKHRPYKQHGKPSSTVSYFNNSTKREKCWVKGRCRKCGNKHHSQLHEVYSTMEKDNSRPNKSTQPPAKDGHAGNSSDQSSTYCTMGHVDQCMPSPASAFVRRKGFLATGILTFRSPQGHRMEVRALLDTCSEDCFFSEHMVQTLSLYRQQTSVVCYGVGDQTTSVADALATAYLYSDPLPDFSLAVTGLILKKVAGTTPNQHISTATWHHLKGLKLADPAFNVPGRVDCILNTEVFAAILRNRIKKGLPAQPAALETIFGWVVIGAEQAFSKASSRTKVLRTVTASAEASELSQALTKFWELEEVPPAVHLSPDEEACYDHFKKTHTRNEQGRFVLRLPFKEAPTLPDSKAVAETCLNRQIRRFKKNPQVGEAYSTFRQEYSDLRHMEVVPEDEATNPISGYIPHHCVFKLSKIRVVFNGSQRYSNGRSLNSYLHIGPKLQEDVLIIILRWSFFPIVFTCDVVKMFRQFLVHPEDRDYQRIVWRPSFNDDLKIYRLNTVTYGEGCAPFQANACMLQLADDGESQYPKAAEALRQNRYADDFYIGEDTVEGACESRKQFVQLLSSAGMEVGKWASNRVEVLRSVKSPEPNLAINVLQEQEVVSTLGLRWLPSEDAFNFKVSTSSLPKVITKRFLLSEISKLFDPIGYLSPVVTRGKILLQNLWLKKLGWDDPVPPEIQEAWTIFHKELLDLEKIKIPRWLGTNSFSGWDLHCFCDASKRAYAAAIYVVTPSGQTFSSKLLVSKSKVAPIKVISIPKLELCAAALLVKLLLYILKHLKRNPSRILCWSDSKVVLAWLLSHPSRWKTFIANRVSFITTSLPADTHWGYVSTLENPADLPTRGLKPSELKDSSLWWHGPTWLTKPSSEWPKTTEQFTTQEESSPDESHVFVSQESDLMAWTEKFSSIDKLVRILSYIHRWRANSKLERSKRRVGGLCASELKVGLTYLMRIPQKAFFSAELQSLKQGQKIAPNSIILRLSPELKSDGLLHVGGRLQNSYLTDEEKHPIILPTNNHIAKLLVAQAHKKTLHGGPTVVQSHLNRKFWLVRGRNFIRKVVHDCVKCARYGGAVIQQQMAPLPAGADEELYQLFCETSAFSEEVAASIAKDGVTWSYIPPRAPHFGGLWETNVRSFKKHLYKVIGNNKLTFEEFYTLSCTIESCLNSRPLSPLSSNPEDLAALTPGHFLIGAALTSVPEPFDQTNESVSPHTRWHLLSLMRNHFWKRWKSEFLSQMQQRSKWLYPNVVHKVGDLVLFRDDQLPPSKWPLARIVRLHLGKDGLSRVAVIKTATKEYTRALNSLVRLPINTEVQEDQPPPA